MQTQAFADLPFNGMQRFSDVIGSGKTIPT